MHSTEYVRHHGRAFAFQAQGLSNESYSPECGLDWLHCWLEGQGPDQVAAVHTALIESEGRDRESFDVPELEAVTMAEEQALYVSVPENHHVMPHQAIVVKALREH